MDDATGDFMELDAHERVRYHGMMAVRNAESLGLCRSISISLKAAREVSLGVLERWDMLETFRKAMAEEVRVLTNQLADMNPDMNPDMDTSSGA